MGIIPSMLTYILVAMILVTMLFLTLTRLAVERIERAHHGQRTDFFKHYPVNAGDIVFVGDSITDGGCWDEMFPGVPLKNRGINADTTIGVLNRIDGIVRARPKAIFLLIGTNDLNSYTHRSNNEILATYTSILERCAALSPETRVFVQSILPRRKNFTRRIQALNERLEALSSRFGYAFINLYPSFVNEEGGLRAEFTNDNLHLMAAGYLRWTELLQPYIKELTSN